MGSSKKHKEKRDRKKHKHDRSRSREKDRESHRRSHKSSHRHERRPDHIALETELSSKKRTPAAEETVARPEPERQDTRVPSDDEFDIDKLLESKLSENLPRRNVNKRKRENAIEEFRLAQRIKQERNDDDDDSLERFATEQLFEEDPYKDDVGGFRIKEEPQQGREEPQLSSIIQTANKIRAKLGFRPLDDDRESTSRRNVSGSSENARKSSSKQSAPPPPPPPPPPPVVEDDGEGEFSEPQLSLSIAETNKLRAKLGLKPLEVDGGSIPGIESEEKKISEAAAEVFVKTENIAEKKRSEALREKLKVMKDKRAIEEKLRKTKGIADSDSEEESAAAWVVKHQKVLLEKEAAEKRAKLLEEMDAEFGVGALIQEEFDKEKAYTSQNLKGITIGHDAGSFQEGHQIILTLKDKGVLEEEDDVLENVNLVDNERHAKNVENKKKKLDYKAYEEPEFDEFGILKKKNLLSKYDEEIDGEKKKAFRIGEPNSTPYVSKEQELELIRMKLKQQNEITLDMPEMKVANEYYTNDEMVHFKKPKKKRKVRKSAMLKADDLVPECEEEHFGSRRRTRPRNLDAMDVDDDPASFSGIPLISAGPSVDLSCVKIEEDSAEKELHSALYKARKLKERKAIATAPEKVMEILNSVDGGSLSSLKSLKSSAAAANIELNSVAEFCRTLGDIPTYGMSGNRDDEAEDMLDLERELQEERMKQELDAQNQGAWNEVDIEERPAEISMRENEPILEEEPDISLGVVGALDLAMKKGYLDKETKKIASARASQLQAQSYTIEEKFYEDDKFGKRDRYPGPVTEFREKSNYKPDVKLEYIDDSGRLLSAKEAFRYLSHKFHGKGPGKNKVDKRMKKLDQDTRLKQMSSTDTPLNTVKLLQQKQKETQSPYIVLSGGNKTLTQTMISKTKT